MPNFNRSSLVLSVNRALWGEVSPAMRMVCARVHGGKFHLQVVFNGKVSNADQAGVARIGAQALTGDFKELTPVYEAVRLDVPQPLVLEDGWSLVYKRREQELSS